MLAGLEGDPNEVMASAMRALQSQTKVELKEVVVRTYDLRRPDDVNQYIYDQEAILLGNAAKTHVMMVRQPLEFVAPIGDRPAGYIAHLEWIEYQHKTVVAETVQHQE